MKATLSYAELMAWRDGCRALGGPVADDSAKAIDWYLSNEPLEPGDAPDEGGDKDLQIDIGADGTGPIGDEMGGAPGGEGGIDVPPPPPGEGEEINVKDEADSILPEAE